MACGLPPPCTYDSDKDKPATAEETDSCASGTQPGAQAAVVCAGVIWEKREVLQVHFLNPEVLTRWKLPTDTILEWANVWKPIGVEFEETTKIKRADIRVEFSDTDMSWSMIGMCAETIKRPKPTMVLNLRIGSVHCPTKEAQRSLVIHEFGHALGLAHEHQRVDFWDHVEPHVDIERMMDDPRVSKAINEPGKESIGGDWKVRRVSIVKSLFTKLPNLKEKEFPYDPDSIMHYWFDRMWLTDPNLHDLRNVRTSTKLNEKEKMYLSGIHKRQNGLAENPSENDIDMLKSYYQNQK